MPGTRTTVFEPRTVDIRPPSLRSETTMVARLAMVIIGAVGFYLANTVWNVDPRSARVATAGERARAHRTVTAGRRETAAGLVLLGLSLLLMR